MEGHHGKLDHRLLRTLPKVPANRLGYGEFSATQLKTIQEVVTILVFAGFCTVYLGEVLTWRYAGAFLCRLGAVAFTFIGRDA